MVIWAALASAAPVLEVTAGPALLDRPSRTYDVADDHNLPPAPPARRVTAALAVAFGQRPLRLVLGADWRHVRKPYGYEGAAWTVRETSVELTLAGRWAPLSNTALLQPRIDVGGGLGVTSLGAYESLFPVLRAGLGATVGRGVVRGFVQARGRVGLGSHTRRLPLCAQYIVPDCLSFTTRSGGATLALHVGVTVGRTR